MSTTKVVRERDTGAWIFQVWGSFVAATGIAGWGILNLPVEQWVRLYLMMGGLFTLGSAFSLAKTTRDNRYRSVDTPAWRFQAWTAFALSVGLTLWGIASMQAELWLKAFSLSSLLFVVSTAFTLAKTIRDNHEAARFARADADGDGALSRDEVQAGMPELAEGFDRLDRNGNGRIERHELRGRADPKAAVSN